MATPQAILTANACVACPQSSLVDILEIGILTNILSALGATMTTTEINTAAACFLCLGMSLAEAQKLVLLNAIASNIPAGGVGSPNLSGAGSPVGVVTPTAINQFYRDTVGNALWISTGLTNADWTALIV